MAVTEKLLDTVHSNFKMNNRELEQIFLNSQKLGSQITNDDLRYVNWQKALYISNVSSPDTYDNDLSHTMQSYNGTLIYGMKFQSIPFIMTRTDNIDKPQSYSPVYCCGQQCRG